MSNIIKTTCSSCSLDLALDAERGVVLATVPWNGDRGKGRISAHDVEGDLFWDDDLYSWECPDSKCGYPDSYMPSFYEDE